MELDEANGKRKIEERVVYKMGSVVDLGAHAGEAACNAGDFAIAAVEHIPEVDEDEACDFGPQGREGEEGRSDDPRDHHEDGYYVGNDAEPHEPWREQGRQQLRVVIDEHRLDGAVGLVVPADCLVGECNRGACGCHGDI